MNEHPAPNTKVFQYVGGWMGETCLEGITYIARNGSLRVRLISANNLLAGSIKTGKTYPFTPYWKTSKQLRAAELRAKEAQEKQNAELDKLQSDFLAATMERVNAALLAGETPLTPETPLGSRLHYHQDNRMGTLIEPEPWPGSATVYRECRFDDGSSMIVQGSEQFITVIQ